MALDKVLDKQTRSLDDLANNAKQDKLIQLLQLREEMKIDKEDAEHLDRVKETNKTVKQNLDVNVSMAKDVKKVTETVTGAKKLQELEILQQLQQSVEKLVKSLNGQRAIQKNEKIESGNKPFAGSAAPVADNTARKQQNLDARLERRDTWRENQGSGLRTFLYGKDSKGKGGMFENFLSKREDKMADKRLAKMERKEYIAGAMQNDAGTIGVKNLAGGVNTESGGLLDPKKWNWKRRMEGRMNASKYAGSKFDALKGKEDEIVSANDAIKSSKKFGYAPKLKDVDAKKKATSELFEMKDPREISQDKAEARAAKVKVKEDKRQEKVQAKEAVVRPPESTTFAKTSEAEEEGKAERAKFEADSVGIESKQVETTTAMGATLIASLEVHKAILEAIKAGGTGGGGGGSLIGDALDAASSLGKGAMKRGAGMLGKAAGFIGKNAGKIGAIGGVAMGAYDAYTGWGDANEAEAKGEITHDEANVKKSEAVGGGVGGAAGAWGGAAAGAAIGSVVPVVGTAIGGIVGGALGYMGGSAIGSKVGGSLTKGYQGVKSMLGFGGDDKAAQVAPSGTTKGEMETLNGTVVEKGKTLTPEQMQIVDANVQHGIKQSPLIMEAYNLTKKQPKPEGSGTAGAIQSKTNELNDTKDAAAGKGGGNNIVAAPVTNINNSNTANNQTRMPVRSEDNSLNSYVRSRYAMY